MNSYFLLIKYTAIKVEQGPHHLSTNEEVGLLCSNSRWDFLASQILYIRTKVCGREDSRAQTVFSGLHNKGRTSVKGSFCILLADGDCIFAWLLLPLSYPLSLLAELCSVIVDQTMHLSSWLIHSNLVSFLPLKILFIFKTLLVGLCQRLPLSELEGGILRGDTLPVPMYYGLSQVCSPKVQWWKKVN